MKVEITHSIVQDMSVVKFNKLSDYFRCIQFLDSRALAWEPLKYSSAKDTASIRVNEVVLNAISKRYGVGKNANTNSDGGLAWMR
jgi:hypothetical protein